jgi:hypothetical protein
MGIKRTQNFTLISKLLRKNAKNLVTKELQAKEVCKIGVCPLLYYYLFWQITFYNYTFFKLSPRFEISGKFCIFLILLC